MIYLLLKRMFGKENIKITKVGIICNLIFSPLIALLFLNISYICNIFKIYPSIAKSVNLEIIFFLLTPTLFFCISFLNYGISLYRRKTIFITFIGSFFLKILNILFTMILIFIIFRPFNYQVIMLLFLINLTSIPFVFLNTRAFKEHFHDIKNLNKFKVSFTDVEKLNRVFILLNNINILYYHDHLIINKHKFSYQDIKIFEDQFNKKIYDFDKNELNIINMYVL